MPCLKASIRLLAATALCLAPWTVHAQASAYACVSGPNVDGGSTYNYACEYSDTGVYVEGTGTSTGPYAVSAAGSGDVWGGPWSNQQSADLATGVMRSTILFSSPPGDPGEYQIGNYIDLFDTLTFTGSGRATFVMRLTGRFMGDGHYLYGNTMDTSLDLTRVGNDYDDVLGRIHLAHWPDNQAHFTAGTTCGASWYVLGSVQCSVASLEAQDVDITLRVTIDDVQDGEVYWLRSSLNVQAYAPRMGGTDFGQTARLGVVLSEGLNFSSASGVLLTQAAPIPEPGAWALMLAGLAVVARVGRRRSLRV